MRQLSTLFFALLILLTPALAQAATLYLTPSSGSYTAGKAFTVTAYVASPEESMNAVSASISVDTSRFSIVSASSVGSVVNFWVQQPSVSGSSISFEGVVLNPGYQGGGAKVASFVLMPKSSGTGSVSFASASVLANDGQGTQILDSTSGGSFTVKDAEPAPSAPSVPAAVPTTEEPEPAPPPPTTDSVVAPQITDYEDDVSFGDLAAFRGVTYENASLEFLVYKNGELVATEYTQSNSSGDFSLVISKRLEPGTYEVYVRVTNGEGQESEPAGPFVVRVHGDVFDWLDWFTTGHLALLALGILAAIGALSVMHAIGWRHLFRLTREFHASQGEAADVTRKVFAILKKDIATHVKNMRAAGENRTLTAEEIAFLEDFEQELEEAEAALKSKTKRVRKIKPSSS